MKIILILALIIFCGMLGYGFASYFIQRKHFFTALHGFCNSLELEINFLQEKLKVVVENNQKKFNNKELEKLCINFIKYLTNQEVLTEQTLFANINILKPEEKTLIYSFFKGLGHLDSGNQSEEIKKYNKLFDDYLISAKKESSKFASLYIKLGIILGLFIGILFI